MNLVKVKFNEPDPDPVVINKYKNFDQFLDNYKKYYSTGGIRYLLKHDIKRLVFIVIIILLLLILLIAESEAHPHHSFEILNYISLPFSGLSGF